MRGPTRGGEYAEHSSLNSTVYVKSCQDFMLKELPIHRLWWGYSGDAGVVGTHRLFCSFGTAETDIFDCEAAIWKLAEDQGCLCRS